MNGKTTLLALALLGCSQSASAGAFVHLFEWQWTDVAQECEQFLGPKGFTAVQVSPPNEHIQGASWWTRYQPVSYILQSRSGTPAQFADMVSRCKAAGVDIYVDAVINHMAANSGVGTAGSSYDVNSLSYPIYSSNDFNANCDINQSDYANDAWRVRHCRLTGLPDLNTSDSTYVQPTIANYLNHLLDLGVAGFRLDASKHMDPSDIAAIESRLNGSPYVFQEVIDNGGEAISSSEYTGNGDVTEFKYTSNLGNVFRNQRLSYLSTWGESWGFISSQQAVVFTDNHDNQRNGTSNILTYKDGDLYTLANVFMLAHPYGYPKIMSSFYFNNHDDGPSSSPVWNNGQPSGCNSQWVCEHRWRPIANMVGFRNATDGYALSNWWDNGNNQIAFGRSGHGFVVINRENGSLQHTFTTGMADGDYCNVIAGDPENQCRDDNGSSHYVTVSNGTLNINVPAMTAVAIYQGASCSDNCQPGDGDGNGNDDGDSNSGGDTGTPGATVSVQFTCNNGSTYLGQSVYVIGNVPALGNWAPAQAVLLQSDNYPTWSASVTVPNDTAIEWKCLKRDEDDVNAGLQWQGGSNNSFNSGETSAVSASF